MAAAVGVPDSPPAAKLPPGAYYALTVLTALNVINVWHRYLLVSVLHTPRARLSSLNRVSPAPRYH
ncbi:unnamed protein product [Ectocarpus sp. CCAP 1310/34]|nr:unnamed protein product [Ectocarpus sp. CCAP 1310/34]